jgi:hypothetical protein
LVALDAPVSPPVTEGAAQEYSVPAGTMPLIKFVGVAVNEVPLQMAAVIALIAANGLTATVIVNTAPLQKPEVGVMM